LSRGNPHSSILVRVISRNKITLAKPQPNVDGKTAPS
jgi:hypothetical protein